MRGGFQTPLPDQCNADFGPPMSNRSLSSTRRVSRSEPSPAWFTDTTDHEEFPVVFEMGDKSFTATPNQWYPPIINRTEAQTIPNWERNHPTHRAWIRRTR